MLNQMPKVRRRHADPGPPDAAAAIAYLGAVSADLRACAIVDSRGRPLAATGESERLGAAAAEFLSAADAAEGHPIEHAHLGTGDGEVFAVRHGDLAAIAVTDRFTLASLMVFDMRAALRDLAGKA
jgi:hypothetical protein